MTDEITAQRILQDWATSKGFSTTLTVDGPQKKLYFHADGHNGFAYLNFEKSPTLKLIVSNDRFIGAHGAFLQAMVFESWGEQPWQPPQSNKKKYDEYDLNLADEKVFTKIERILDRAIDSYGG